jgi:hypothetical protein
MIGIAPALVAAALLFGDAPDGFNSTENKDDGFALFYPQAYKEIPPQPNDPVILARYTRTKQVEPPKGVKAPPRTDLIGEIWVVSIDKPKSAGGTTPGDAPTPDGGDGTEASAKAAHSEAEVALEQMRASSFEEFVKKRLATKPKWGILSHAEKTDRGTTSTDYLLQAPPSGPPEARGFAKLIDKGDHWLGLVGLAAASEFEGQRKLFERSANSLHEIAVSEAAVHDMEIYYSHHPEMKEPKFRIERRRELRRGWKSIDTKNYLIIHHSKDEHLLDRLQNDLEAMRVTYEQLFPPVKPVEAVSVVRVCKDRQEYLQYGGMAMSAGYWNFVSRELVLYDNVKGEQGSRLGNQDSYIVVYHEAFHQYIHYSTGELPPHSWFNEGYGDFFSGAKIYANSTKVQEIGPNPWRLPVIKNAIDKGQWIGFDKLLHANQNEYYGQAQIFYAEGWSFIYFLNRGLSSHTNPKWEHILPTYFETLKASYGEEVRTLGDSATVDQKRAAGEKARKKAVDAALEGIDLEELQDAWLKFFKRLK